MKPMDIIERDVLREYLFEIRRNLQIAKICEIREEINEHIGIALSFVELLENPGRGSEVKIA